MPRIPRGDTHTRHASSHHSDHSGAHVRGTSHHMKHAQNPYDGLTPNEGGNNAPADVGDNDADDMVTQGHLGGGGGGMPGGM